MSDKSFSFEYGQEEEDKKPLANASVKKANVKHKKVKVEKEENKIPIPQDVSPTSPILLPVEKTITTAPVSLPKEATIISVPHKEVDKEVEKIDTTVVAVIAVAATTAVVATGISALSKAGNLKTKTSKNKSSNNQQNQQKNKQEEKKKEEQTKCDAKSKEVQSLIDETMGYLSEMEVNFNSSFGIEADKELAQKFEEVREELKKVKKTIKNF